MTPAKPPGGSVFLVEDEVMIRMMVADMLEELGYSIAAEAGEIDKPSSSRAPRTSTSPSSTSTSTES